MRGRYRQDPRCGCLFCFSLRGRRRSGGAAFVSRSCVLQCCQHTIEMVGPIWAATFQMVFRLFIFLPRLGTKYSYCVRACVRACVVRPSTSTWA